MARLRLPSVDPGVTSFLWALFLGGYIWGGLLAIDVSRATSFILGVLGGAAIFLFVRVYGEEQPGRQRARPLSAMSEGAAFPPGSESRSFIKDWVTTLIATSGVLVTIVLAVLALFHNARTSFSWTFLAVDIPAVLAMVCFLRVIQLSFQSLGALISGTGSHEKAQTLSGTENDETMKRSASYLEESRRGAAAARRLFVLGVTLTVLAGIAVVSVLSTIADQGGAKCNEIQGSTLLVCSP